VSPEQIELYYQKYDSIYGYTGLAAFWNVSRSHAFSFVKRNNLKRPQNGALKKQHDLIKWYPNNYKSFTKKEIATLFNCSEDFVARLAKENGLPRPFKTWQVAQAQGLMRCYKCLKYYKPETFQNDSYNDVAYRQQKQKRCRECQNAIMQVRGRDYYQNNKERCKAIAKRWALANRDKVNAYQRARYWRKKNERVQ
jgi:hypothetical protein